MRIDPVDGSPLAQQPDRALCIFETKQHLGPHLLAVLRRPHLRHPIFQHGAGHSLPHRPVADLRALQIERDDFEPASGQDQQRRAAVAPLRPEDGHRRAGDIARPVPQTPADATRTVAQPLGAITRIGFGERDVGRPERSLHPAARGLPDAGTFVLREDLRRPHRFGFARLATNRAARAECEERRHDESKARHGLSPTRSPAVRGMHGPWPGGRR